MLSARRGRRWLFFGDRGIFSFGNSEHDDDGRQHGSPCKRLGEKQPGGDNRQKRLEVLGLADAGDAAKRKAVIPGKKAEKHADDADVAKASPDGPGGMLQFRQERTRDWDDEKRESDNQRPADHLPAAKRFGELPADGVADGSGHDGSEQREVSPLQGAKPGENSVADNRQARDYAGKPVRFSRALSGKKGGCACCCERQQGDNDRAVGSGHALHCP